MGNLIELLDTREKRQLKMVETLYGGEWFILKNLSAQLGANERTLRGDIQVLNEKIAPLWVETSKQFGVRLVSPQGYSLKYYYSLVLKYNVAFNILEHLFIETFSSVDELADFIYVTPEQLRATVRKINQVFEPYGVEVDLKNMVFCGDERTIVSFYRNYFLERYDYELPFDKELVNGSIQAVKDLYAEEEAKILPLNRNLLAFFTTLRILRVKHNVGGSNLPSQRERGEVYTPAIERFNETTNRMAGTTEPYDFFQGTWRPQADEFFFFRLDQFQEFREKNADVAKDYQAILTLAKEIESTLGIRFLNREWFIFNFYNISLQEKYFFPILHGKIPNLLDAAKTITPYLYRHLGEIAEKYVGCFFGAGKEHLLYNILSAWDQAIEVGIELQPKLKIAMFSMYNSLTFRNNFYLLQHEFKDLFEITMMTEDFETAQARLNQEFDLVITDQFSLDLSVDTFCFPYDISLQELTVIRKYYDEVTAIY